MKRKDFGALILLAALWGAPFLFYRVAAPVLGPIVLVFLRVVLAGVALIAYAAITRRATNWRARLRAFLVLGALNAALPYVLIATAELHITASLATILNATTPLFTAVVAVVRLGDRLTPRTVLGLLFGFAGVAILVGWSPLPVDALLILSVGACLTAALSYGLAGVFAKTAFAGTPPLTLAIGQQVGASLLLLPFALPIAAAGKTDFHPSAVVVASVLGLALLCTSLGYLLYFFLIDSVGPTRTLSVTFLMPGFGVLWNVLFLDETIGAGTFAGLGVILASVFLVIGVDPRRRTTAAASPVSPGSPRGELAPPGTRTGGFRSR